MPTRGLSLPKFHHFTLRYTFLEYSQANTASVYSFLLAINLRFSSLVERTIAHTHIFLISKRAR